MTKEEFVSQNLDRFVILLEAMNATIELQEAAQAANLGIPFDNFEEVIEILEQNHPEIVFKIFPAGIPGDFSDDEYDYENSEEHEQG